MKVKTTEAIQFNPSVHVINLVEPYHQPRLVPNKRCVDGLVASNKGISKGLVFKVKLKLRRVKRKWKR